MKTTEGAPIKGDVLEITLKKNEMSYIFETNFDELTTFESFFKGYIIKNNNILIPYINIGASEHPLNMANDLLHINYSYMVCMDVIIIKYNSKLIHDETLGKFGAYKIVYLGGTDLNIDTNVEYQIICKSAFLQITDKTKLSKDFWVPFKTSKLNMDEYEVKNFFSFENLPENLYELFFNT